MNSGLLGLPFGEAADRHRLGRDPGLDPRERLDDVAQAADQALVEPVDGGDCGHRPAAPRRRSAKGRAGPDAPPSRGALRLAHQGGDFFSGKGRILGHWVTKLVK